MNVERGGSLSGRPVEALTGEGALEGDGPDGPRYVLAGARAHTPSGLRPIEELARGDLVATAGGELVAVVAVERFSVDAATLRERPGLAPILIEAGALGNFAAFGLSPHHPVGARRRCHGGGVPDGTGAMRKVRDLLGRRAGLRPIDDARAVEYVRIATERQADILVEGVPIASNGPDATGARPAAAAGRERAAPDYPAGPGILGPLLFGWLAGASAFAATLVAGGGPWLGTGVFVLCSACAVVGGAFLAALLTERRLTADAISADRVPNEAGPSA
jgi:hypothetical protein